MNKTAANSPKDGAQRKKAHDDIKCEQWIKRAAETCPPEDYESLMQCLEAEEEEAQGAKAETPTGDRNV